MLPKQSVSPKLLELLSFVMKKEEFNDFILVGGTSLALQMNHRISIDIDLFGKSELDEELFFDILSEFGKTILLKKSKNILIFSVDNIKIDFVNYRYPLIQKPMLKYGFRLASQMDIAAMKLNAIACRGSKKDFIDLFYLLKKYSLQDMMEFYKQKYQDGSEFMVLKSLTYFDDADKEESPIVFEKVSWETIKTEILSHIKW
ncbi:MAG: nucleotidyl transferase AbiEii/AbiGii toxin family protein [Flavobacteriia bacterium]|nr:nucleotidyl transferase AbiEii/AbiGii toxin family protein [Flavobacteriia bacterium]